MLEERRTFDLSSKYIKRRNLLKESGLVGGLEEVNNQLQYEIDKIEYYNKIVDVHAAQARLINSVGADLETVTHFMLQGDDEPVEELPQAQSPQELQQIPEHGLTKEPQPQLEQQELEKDSE